MEIRYRCSLDDYLEAQSCESKSVAYYLYWIFSALFLLWGIYQAVTAGFAQAFGKSLMAGTLSGVAARDSADSNKKQFWESSTLCHGNADGGRR